MTNTTTTSTASYEENMNYLAEGLIALKYILFAINTILCIVTAAWTIINRNEWIVKVSQPVILLCIILGCFISNLSLLFEGMETDYRTILDPETGEEIENPDIPWVDAACMAAPWFFITGFSITISMLLAKIQRVRLIHKVNNTTASMGSTDNNDSKNPTHNNNNTQKKIDFKDVAYIVAIVVIINLGLLTVWQVISPDKWDRVPVEDSEDEQVESYGYCSDQHGDTFEIVIFSFHVLLLFCALILCWQTRDFDGDFAESNHISLAILFIFQVGFFGLVIIQLLQQDNNNNNIFFFVRMSVAFLTNFIVLVILFLPKMMKLYNIKNGQDAKKKKTIPLSALTHSRWDEGVDIINGLLDGESDTYHTMTEEQRNGLKGIKELLLKGVHPQQDDKLRFIPQALMQHGMIEESKRASGTTTYRTKRGVLVGDSVHFLVREYGGIHLDSYDMDSYDEENDDDDDTCANTSQDIESHETGGDEMSYIPEEFRNLSQEEKLRVYKLLSWSVLQNWDYDIFELSELSGGHPLLLMGYAILGSPHSLYAMGKNCGALDSNASIDSVGGGYHFVDDASLSIPMRKLCNYLRTIEEDYTSDNPYHNEIHGADVLQTLHALIQMKGDRFQTTKDELFSILLAAVVHDVNHPGENNAFQMNSITDLALVYNDISVLENRHASHAFAKMLTGGTVNNGTNSDDEAHIGNKDSDNNILCNVSNGTLFSIRKRIIDAVLHTDMSKHFQSVDALRALVLSGGIETEDGPWKILQYMLHLADISNPAKPKKLALLWTDRCLEEFFAQGDKESKLGLAISPNCDRKTTRKADSQIGFISFVIQPAYEVLAQIIPSVKSKILVPHIETNLEYWKQEKEMMQMDSKEEPEAKV